MPLLTQNLTGDLCSARLCSCRRATRSQHGPARGISQHLSPHSPEKLPLKWLIPTPSGMEPERCTLNEKQLSREECVSSCIPGQQQLVLGQVLCLSLSEPQHLPLPVPADCLLPQECSVSGQGLNTPCSAPRLAGISSPRCAGSAGIASIQHKVSCCPSSQRAQAKNRK